MTKIRVKPQSILFLLTEVQWQNIRINSSEKVPSYYVALGVEKSITLSEEICMVFIILCLIHDIALHYIRFNEKYYVS